MRKWLPLFTVCLGTFMLLVDATIVTVALPDIAADLRTSFGTLQWVVDAYTVTLAALVLGAGSLADLAGHRRAYLAGLLLFVAASLACGYAPNAAVLVGARAVQGIGAAAMFATAFGLINSNYTGRDRGTAYGVFGAVSGIASAAGPILGGLISDAASWRWVFFVNLPVGVLAVAICLTALHDTGRTGPRGRVDVSGMATFTAGTGMLVYGLIRANEHGWSQPASWLPLAGAPVMLSLFLLVQRRGRNPMLDLSMLRNRMFVGVLLGASALTFAAFGTYTFASIWLQSVIGLSAVAAGLTVAPLPVVSFAVAAATGRRLHGAKPGPIIGGGLLLVGAGALLDAAMVRGGASWPELIPGYVVTGAGVGLATPILASAAAAAVPVHRVGMAGGALNTMRQLGLALGIAVLGGAFSARACAVLADRGVPGSAGLGRQLSGGQAQHLITTAPPAIRSALDYAFHMAAASGLRLTFLIGGVVGLAAGATVLRLMRAAAIGHPAAADATAAPGPPVAAPAGGRALAAPGRSGRE